MATTENLPRWSTTDLHESLDARSFVGSMEQLGADITRLINRFDDGDVRAVEARAVSSDDGALADELIDAYNAVGGELETLFYFTYAFVSTDSRNDKAQAVLSEIADQEARLEPLNARLADWVASLGVSELAAVSERVAEHRGPLERLATRTTHQLTELEENLVAELQITGSGSWNRLQRDVTSQLTADVTMPGGEVETMSMPAVRGLATNPDVGVRRAAYEAELATWPTVGTTVAAAMNAIKGEANTLNRRRQWGSPLDVSLFGNAVSRPTFDAMQEAVTDALPDFRRWMRVKAQIHAKADGSNGDEGLAWWDLVAPLPTAGQEVSWEDGIETVRSAFGEYSPQLGGLVDRALDEQWIDAPPADGKSGGAFCAPFFDGRSLILLNWSGSAESTQTTAHELGHAYHNTTLAGRTSLQRNLPMALAETASIFCETLVVESGLAQVSGAERLALLDVDLQGSNQVVVDIRSRFLFETELFARRQRRVLGVDELNELMTQSQLEAYGDGLDQSTAHPYMWLLKPHYYGAHFYNWPYTYGLLFGLGLFARYQEDPDHFRSGYDDLLSRAGMDDAETLGQSFGLDVTDVAFWTASLDVLRARIDEYERLANELGLLA